MNPQHVVDKMLPIVCSKLNCTKTAVIDIEIFENFDKTVAFCKYMSEGHYKICYHKECSDKLTVICHELVHIVQHLRGDVFRTDLPYREQPHEIEAYALEVELKNTYLSLD